MRKEIIKDKEGNPVSLILDYREWVLVERFLSFNMTNFNLSGNPLDWYVVTESLNLILTELIAYSGRERFKELRKNKPRLKRVENLKGFSEDLKKVSRDWDNFKDVRRMRHLVDVYAPLLEEINNGKHIY
ncbi:hypothetical protein [Chryseobacterium sp. c4a]|uniref:hypothetical protein n=1 Tax=Chryseobacterium sp. c4a TaxID=1573582 RepID=UPI001357943C|nr:hypothetical protein [Chryseobacterium sp. c4a]